MLVIWQKVFTYEFSACSTLIIREQLVLQSDSDRCGKASARVFHKSLRIHSRASMIRNELVFHNVFSGERVHFCELRSIGELLNQKVSRTAKKPFESHQSSLPPTYLVWLSGRRWICECSWLWSIARLFYVLVCLRHLRARINIQDLSRTWFAEIWSDWTAIRSADLGLERMAATTFGETDSLPHTDLSEEKVQACWLCPSWFDYNSE